MQGRFSVCFAALADLRQRVVSIVIKIYKWYEKCQAKIKKTPLTDYFFPTGKVCVDGKIDGEIAASVSWYCGFIQCVFGISKELAERCNESLIICQIL